MRAYLIGLYPGIGEIVCNGFEPPIDPKNPTLEEMRIIHLNGQATSVLLSALDGDEYNCRVHKPGVPQRPASQQMLSPALQQTMLRMMRNFWASPNT